METRRFSVENLAVKVYRDRSLMGANAGREVAAKLRDLLGRQKSVSAIFAAAPSQNETLAELCRASGIDWSRVVAFHMDEYLGLPGTAPQSFGRFLREAVFEKVQPGRVNYLDGTADPEKECARYSALLRAQPVDIVCMGIGENGHLAFNDPPVADFKDPKTVKPVELDLPCRQQQVNDGCFPSLDRVPKTALSLTIPALLSARTVFCMVPGPRKVQAVMDALQGPIATSCPASILRTHADATLYLDDDSARLVDTAIAGR